MSNYIYIDESGYEGDYIFAAVCISNPEIPKKIIKKWRKWMKNRIKNFNQNEYHDYNARSTERKKILEEIALHKDDISLCAVLKRNYNGNHNELYVPTIVTLLEQIKIEENDTVITVDKVDKRVITMDKYMRKIKSKLEMPGLEIYFKDSEKEKGIQITDAIAGAISREYLPRSAHSYYALINELEINKLKII